MKFSKVINTTQVLNLTAIFTLIFFASSTNSIAQNSSIALAYENASPIATTLLDTDQATKSSTTAFLPATERAASFAGGQAALDAYLNANINYPEIAQEYGVEGTIKIRFKVMAGGSLAHFSVKESLNKECDELVLSVLQAMPNWIPAQQGIHKVGMWCEVPVKFILQ